MERGGKIERLIRKRRRRIQTPVRTVVLSFAAVCILFFPPEKGCCLHWLLAAPALAPRGGVLPNRRPCLTSLLAFTSCFPLLSATCPAFFSFSLSFVKRSLHSAIMPARFDTNSEHLFIEIWADLMSSMDKTMTTRAAKETKATQLLNDRQKERIFTVQEVHNKIDNLKKKGRELETRTE